MDADHTDSAHRLSKLLEGLDNSDWSRVRLLALMENICRSSFFEILTQESKKILRKGIAKLIYSFISRSSCGQEKLSAPDQHNDHEDVLEDHEESKVGAKARVCTMANSGADSERQLRGDIQRDVKTGPIGTMHELATSGQPLTR